MRRVNVLVADDDREIRELIKTYLEREQYEVNTAADGTEALARFNAGRYDLALLDVMMPGIDGLELCRQIRSRSNIPIVMLTAKDEETDKIIGLGIGADDYITKPFSIHEVVARVRSLMRRYLVLGASGTADDGDPVLRYKGLRIDAKTYTATVRGDTVALTAKEFELLQFLASHPEQVFTKIQLFRQLWDNGYIEDDNTVMVHIRKLRVKIEEDPSNPKWIRTVWGIGYKFTGEPDEE
ncbi:response regulator transcription factor [Paenibacillus sp. CN-4]|uniref:response regulator transcription factor n=1 Tax=Paenibacillus nanchangensis TaxID=3348343 RepID=UPI00397C194E